MSNLALPGAHPIPSHVPPHLVVPFDFFSDTEYATDPFSVLRRQHRRGPRIFFTPIHYQKPGSWVLTHAADIREVWQDPELWSSLHNVNFSAIIGESWALSPVELDPPLHGKIRAFLNPFFSPKRLKLLEDDVRSIAVGLINDIAEHDECEFINDFSYPFPVSVFLKLMGLNADGLYQFVDWVKGTTDALHIDRIRASVKAIADYMEGEIDKRRKSPSGDLMSEIVNMRLDGEPASDEQVMGICYLLFLGGLDTMTSSLGFHFAYLAQNPELQHELRADRSKIGATIEELLRLNSIVQVQRCATRDTELAGVQIKKGDWVTLSPGMAHADPREFEQPDAFNPNRANVRHMAFAVGPHRCMGSHLARREFVVAYNEWFDRIPPFRVKEKTLPLMHGGAVFGVSKLELSWQK